MTKNFTNSLLFFAVTLIFIVTGCGSSGSSTAPLATNAAQSKVFGVASLGTTATSTITVKDSSVPSQEKTAALSSNGTYTADVSGLKAPFILKASGTDETGGNLMLYSVSANSGRANINEISDLAVAAAASMETSAAGMEMAYSWSNNDDNHRTTDNFDRVINSLRTVLAPLFALYNISGNPVSDEDGGELDGEHHNSGLSALLHDVRFKVTNGNVQVTNRATGGVIFSGPLNNLASGTFHTENMPAVPGGSTACTYNYSNWGTCQSNGTQARTVLQSTPAGCTGSPVLSQSCTNVPPANACTSFTYSAWGTCSNGTQTRTVATSSPAGCTGGTPALSQSCTQPSTLTLAQVTTSCTQCHGLTVNGIVLRTGGYTVSGRSASAWVSAITGMGAVLAPGTTLQDYGNFLAGLSSTPSACTSFTYSGWGTCSNGTQTRTVATSSPAGCTGGTPVLSQSCASACSSFTYSGWGTCQSNSTQTRTVLTSSPTGCTGGTPVLSQSCTYVPPVNACTSFTYSAWGTCQSNGTQTRTVATSSPSGCAGGTPVLSQTCTYVPPTCTSFTYSAWGTCQSNSTQTRTVLTSSPSGCTGGTRVLSQSCTYIPPTPVCGSCHTIPPSTGKHTFHTTSAGLSCGTCHGTGYSSTTVNATTHNNGVKNVVSTLNFSATALTCSPGCHGSRSW